MRARASALAVAVAVVMAPAVAVATAMPAAAWSSLNSLAGPNAWIVADLAAQGGTALVESRQTPGTLDETFTVRTESPDARRAPTTVAKGAGWLSKVPGLGKFGAILDGGHVLLDLGGFSFGGDSWRLGDDAPTLGSDPVPVTVWTGTLTSPRGAVANPARVNGIQSGVSFSGTFTKTDNDYYGAQGLSWQVRCSDGRLVQGVGAPVSGGFQGNGPWPVSNPGWAPSGCNGAAARITETPSGAALTPFVAFTTSSGAAVVQPPSTVSTSTLTSRVECRDATGDTTVVTGSGSAVVAPGQDVAPPDARCPDGMVAVTGSVTATAPDGTVTELVPPVQAPAWVGTIPQQAPGCTLAGAVCSLDLETRVEADTWVSCGIRPDLCTEWETQPAQTPARFRCTYGREVVDLARCSGIVVQPDNAESPLQVDYPFPRPGTAPAPAPTRPADGVQPAPTPGTSRPPADAECRSTLVIFGGMVCALQEAFIPSPAVLARVTGTGSSLGQVTPLPQLRSVGAWLTPPPDLAGRCLDLRIDSIDGQAHGVIPASIPVMNTCDQGHPVVRAMATIRPVAEVAVWVALLAPLAWWAWRQYAPGSQGAA